MICPFCYTSPFAGTDGVNVISVGSSCLCGRISSFWNRNGNPRLTVSVLARASERQYRTVELFQVQSVNGPFGEEPEFFATEHSMGVGSGQELGRVPSSWHSLYVSAVERFFEEAVAEAVLDS